MILGLLLMVLNSPVRDLCDHCLKVTLVKEVFFGFFSIKGANRKYVRVGCAQLGWVEPADV